jgi:hypothetical protein
MSNIIRIKRRASTGALGVQGLVLANAELAYNEADNTLYYGKGTGGAGGTATSIDAIGGPGAYTTLGTTQTVSGAKTFSAICSFTANSTAVTQASSDNSTRLATTAYVKAASVGSVTGTAPITSSGGTSPAISLATNYGDTQNPYAPKTAAFVLAAPAAAAGAPTFRALVAGDIPALDTNKLTSGTLPLARGGTNSADGSITGTGALTFTAGGTNTNITLAPNGTGTVAVSSKRITGVADPTSAQDAATKAYVDAKAQGLDVKGSVRVATTASITLNGTQTIDGVAVVAGNRVLVKNQTTAIDNGIYVVASGAWTRTDDADTSAKVTPGLFVFVEEGTANANSGWVLTTTGSITLGSTSLAFSQFSGAGQITAGDGLTKTGNTLAVGGAANRITVGSTTVDIASTYVGQTSITTLGTIANGTWNATAIAATRGGTGLTSVPQGSVLVANAANTITALDGSGTNGILTYTASTDTITWSNTIDGGEF